MSWSRREYPGRRRGDRARCQGGWRRGLLGAIDSARTRAALHPKSVPRRRQSPGLARGCQAMVFATDGTPLQDRPGGYGGDRRVEYIIAEAARKEGVHEIIFESSCNAMSGMVDGGIRPPDPTATSRSTWRTWWYQTRRHGVCSGTSRRCTRAHGHTPREHAAAEQGPHHLQRDYEHLLTHGPTSIDRTRRLAEDVFGVGWEVPGAGVYDDDGACGHSLVWCIGPCYIDMAWLWLYHVMQQKTACSWATQLDVMERYPDHRFACSQA
ncbi:hypothetical protein B0H13DRAFT_1887345 [Mycena leptocephala]|nr:hypothetical protein B0H13DRAFT_1887345 [Mycena leptocephala]